MTDRYTQKQIKRSENPSGFKSNYPAMLSTSVKLNWLALIWKNTALIASPLSKHTQR